MLVLVGGRNGTSLVHILAVIIEAVAIELSLEVKDHVLPYFQFKTDDGFSCDFPARVGWDVERQVVNDVTDVCFSVVGEFFGDAF